MKRYKFFFLSSLFISFMGILIFSSCNDDDDATVNPYSGYIEYIDPETDSDIKDKCVYVYRKNKRVYAYFDKENAC